MEDGSSPTTSERRRAAVGAGEASRTRPPPFRTETCFLTALISPIWAPLLRRAPVSVFRSASSIGGSGSAKSAEAPPEMRARSSSPSPSDSANVLTLRAASTPRSSGSGCDEKRVSRASGPGSWSSLVTTMPSEILSPSTSTAARAIAPAALPAATTATLSASKARPPTEIERPSTVSERRTAAAGSAAARPAARISLRSSCTGTS